MSKKLGLKSGDLVLKYKYTLLKASVNTDVKDRVRSKCGKLGISESQYVRVLIENSVKDWK